MNTMRLAPVAKSLAFARAAPFAARHQARFGVSALRMMSAAAPGPKVRKYNLIECNGSIFLLFFS